MADQLDDLNNDQLRLRLLEHGLANTPVTSTTRKVLIKRLRNVLDGGDKSKTRRETIHVARFSSGDESESDAAVAAANATKSQRKTKAPSVEKSSSRRATIGVPSSLAAAPSAALPLSQPKPITTRRSSGRITPSIVASQPEPVRPVARAPAVGTLQEDSDDDIQFIPVASASTTARSPSRRQSRSPSMGKSETVVTSYKQVKAPATIVEQPRELLHLVEEDYDDGEPDDDPETSGDAEVSRTFSFGAGSPLQQTKTSQIFSSSKTTTKTSTYGGGVADSQPAADLNVSASRRYTAGTGTSDHQAWQPTTPARPSSVADDLFASDSNTPYLSDFTRRLSRLRAEPLVADVGGSSALRRGRDSVVAGGGGGSAVHYAGSDAVSSPGVGSAYAYRTSTRLQGRQSLAGKHVVGASPATGSRSAMQSVRRACSAFELRFRYQIWSVVAVLVAIFVFTMVFT